MKETLAGLGEAELLRRLARFAPAGQFSDDTACPSCEPGSADPPLSEPEQGRMDGWP